jgi:uncharacterized membrane protein (DUF106 family)
LVFLEPAIEIALICVVLAAISKIIQKKFINKELMKEYKEEIKKINVKVKEAIKEGKKEKASELQKEMFAVQGKMLQMSQKVMFVSLPIFLVAFAMLGFLYGGISFESFIPLPKFNSFFLLNPGTWIPVGITTSTGFYKAYFFYYLIATIVFTIIEKIYEKVR